MDDPTTPATPQPFPTPEQPAQPSAPSPSAAPTSPIDKSAIRELADLALRLLDPSNLSAGAAGEPQLLPGQIAPGFPFAPPLPEGARVVGSYLHGATLTIVLDVPQEPTAAWEFYRDRLGELGWRMEFDPGPQTRGGFTDSSAGNRAFSRFLQHDDGPLLTVMAVEASNGRTSVHLTLDPPIPRPRYGSLARRQMRPGMWGLIPTLQPPPHAQQSPEGGSGNNARITANASLDTDLDLAPLITHYQSQLESGGWRRVNGGASDPTAWSSWEFADDAGEPWRALFVLLRQPDLPHRYYLTIRAEWVGATRPAGNWPGDMAFTMGTITSGGTTFGPGVSGGPIHPGRPPLSSPPEKP